VSKRGSGGSDRVRRAGPPGRTGQPCRSLTAPILLLGTVATAATVISLAAQPTVAGELVKLRPVCASAAATFAFLAAETLRPTGTQRSYRVAELERWYSSGAEPHGRLDWSIRARAAGECAGEVF